MGRKLYWRTRGGRFVRPPSLEALGMVKVCRHCGAVHIPEEPEQTGPFLDPARKFPGVCRDCGKKLADST